METSSSHFKLYLLVRDKDGMPLIDHPESVPKVVWDSFTKEEKDFINNSVMEHLKRYD